MKYIAVHVLHQFLVEVMELDGAHDRLIRHQGFIQTGQRPEGVLCHCGCGLSCLTDLKTVFTHTLSGLNNDHFPQTFYPFHDGVNISLSQTGMYERIF